MSVKCIDRLWQNSQVKCSTWTWKPCRYGDCNERESSRWINRKGEWESFSSWQLEHGLSILVKLHRKKIINPQNWQTLVKMTSSNQIARRICNYIHRAPAMSAFEEELITGFDSFSQVWSTKNLKDIKRLLCEAHSRTWTQYPRAKLYNRVMSLWNALYLLLLEEQGKTFHIFLVKLFSKTSKPIYYYCIIDFR